MRSALLKTCFVAIALSLLTPMAAMAQNEYEGMASICASPLFDSSDEAKVGYTDTKVMLHNELAYQALRGWVSPNSDIEKIRSEVYGHLWNCNSTLAEIRRRDASVPDLEAIAKKVIPALPALDKKRRDAEGNLLPTDQKAVNELITKSLVEGGQWLWDKYQASVERDNYKGHNRKARVSAQKLWTIAAGRCNVGRPMVYGIGIVPGVDDLLGRILIKEVRADSPAKAAGLLAGDFIVAVNQTGVTLLNRQAMVAAISGAKDTAVKLNIWRSGLNRDVSVLRSMAVYEAALLSVDINGSWNGYYESDWVYFTNISGRDLTKVTLYVGLKGRHGIEGRENGDSHLHYVDRWPAGTVKIARYMSSGASGIANDESVDQIDTLTYKMYSDQWQQENVIQYTGEAYDADVKRYCESISMRGSWEVRDDHFMLNSGFSLQNGENGYSFPCSYVSVAGFWGSKRIGYRWTMNNGLFPSGTSDLLLGNSRYFSHADFNRGRPDRVEVVFEFPYTTYKHEVTWDLSR